MLYSQLFSFRKLMVSILTFARSLAFECCNIALVSVMFSSGDFLVDELDFEGNISATPSLSGSSGTLDPPPIADFDTLQESPSNYY